MPVLLVLCDAADAERLEAGLEEYGESFRLSRSIYLLHSRRQHDDVWRSLKATCRLVRPEALFVIRLHRPFIGPLSTDADRWLRRMAEKNSAGRECAR